MSLEQNWLGYLETGRWLHLSSRNCGETKNIFARCAEGFAKGPPMTITGCQTPTNAEGYQVLIDVAVFSFLAAIYTIIGWAAIFVWCNERELKRRGYHG